MKTTSIKKQLRIIPLIYLTLLFLGIFIRPSVGAVVKKDSISSPAVPAPLVADTVATEHPSEPFAWGDFTWLNGNDRRHSAILDSK